MGYNISYAKSKRNFALKILLQLPKIFRLIGSEKRWLFNYVNEVKPDAVISDNRYGFRHPKTYNIFITHQLQLQMPFSMLNAFARAVVYSFVTRFDELWIPDFPGEENLAGSLSHPTKMPPVKYFYIGALNRFAASKQTTATGNKLLFLVSGPEPQRTALEQKLSEVAKYLPHEIVMVCGQPKQQLHTSTSQNLIRKSHLPQHLLEDEITNAACVVARSGYTTVMELFALKKKALLIPTPGQTEQEYLAKHLGKKGLFHTASQQLPAKELAVAIQKLIDEPQPQHLQTASVDLEKFLCSFIERMAARKKQ